MKAFMRATHLLLPLPVYLIATALGQPLAGALAGLALAMASGVCRHGARLPPFELGLVAGLAAAVASLATGLIVRPAAGEALVMVGLAAGAAASLVQRRPWTTAFSAYGYGGAAGTPLFVQINMLISSLWAGLFAWLGLAAALALGPALQWGPLAVGGLASILLPPVLMRRGLQTMVRGTGGTWAPPPVRRPAPRAQIATWR